MERLKQPIYRSRKLLQMAKNAPVCFACDTPNDGTVVMAHSNSSADGKAMSRKAKDSAIAALCHTCHNFYDRGSASREVKQTWWEKAHIKTLRWIVEQIA